MEEEVVHPEIGQFDQTNLQRKAMDDVASSMACLVRDCFAELLELENSLELQKSELAQRKDFTISAAFNYFAKSPEYKLTVDEYQFGLERLHVQTAPGDVNLLFSRYDSDQDGRLGIWEFSNQLLPIHHRAREEVESRRQTVDLTYETRDMLLRMLKRTVDTEAQAEIIRNRVSKNIRIPLRQAFEEIDWLNRGYVTKVEVKRTIDQNMDIMGNNKHIG